MNGNKDYNLFVPYFLGKWLSFPFKSQSEPGKGIKHTYVNWMCKCIQAVRRVLLWKLNSPTFFGFGKKKTRKINFVSTAVTEATIKTTQYLKLNRRRRYKIRTISTTDCHLKSEPLSSHLHHFTSSIRVMQTK